MVKSDETTVVEQQVLERTRQFAQAMVDGDADALEDLLAPDFSYTHKSGRVEPRDELIPSVWGGRRSARMDFEGMRVRTYPGTAIVSGTAHMRVGPADRPLEFDSSFSSVWVDLDGALRLVVYHSTGLPEG